MEFKEVTEEQKNQYDQFVAAQESGSFLQSWQWGEWQKFLGRNVIRYFIANNNTFIGSVQLIRMPLPLGKHYWYAPYGPVVSQNFKFSILNFQKLFPNSVFVRVEPKSHVEGLTSIVKKTANIQPAKTLIIDLLKTEEELLSEMHTKTRYNIKLAQKHGVEIKDEFDISIGHGLFAKEAVELIVQTAERQGFKGYGMEYYNKMIDSLAVQNRGALKLHIYKAIYKNQLLASAIMLDFGKTRTFLFGGSSDANKNLMAPYLLHWQAMLDAKSQELTAYDFWGIETSSGETPGFVRFKLGFAPQSDSGPSGGIREYGGAYDIVRNNFNYKIYLTLRKLNKLTKKFRG